MRLLHSLPAIALAFASPARASISATKLFVPSGFTSNDEIVVVVEGYLSSPCEKLRGAKVETRGHTFKIVPKSETQGKCEELKVPYTLEVVLNPDAAIEPDDDYIVEVAGPAGKVLREPLEVKEPPMEWPESRMYAPVDDADVGLLSGGKMRAVIQGRFQNTCYAIDEFQVSTGNGKTFEAVPIIKPLARDPKGKPCKAVETPYTAYADFDEPRPGRYLLHVRSQSGTAVNRVFTNVW